MKIKIIDRIEKRVAKVKKKKKRLKFKCSSSGKQASKAIGVNI